MCSYQNGGVFPGDDGEGVGDGAAGLLARHGVPLVQALAEAKGRAVGPLPVSDTRVHGGYVVLEKYFNHIGTGRYRYHTVVTYHVFNLKCRYTVLATQVPVVPFTAPDPYLQRHCDKRHKRHAIMMVVAL